MFIVYFSDLGLLTKIIFICFHWLFVGTLYFTVYCVRASDGIVSVSNDICDLSSRNLV